MKAHHSQLADILTARLMSKISCHSFYSARSTTYIPPLLPIDTWGSKHPCLSLRAIRSIVRQHHNVRKRNCKLENPTDPACSHPLQRNVQTNERGLTIKLTRVPDVGRQSYLRVLIQVDKVPPPLDWLREFYNHDSIFVLPEPNGVKPSWSKVCCAFLLSGDSHKRTPSPSPTGPVTSCRPHKESTIPAIPPCLVSLRGGKWIREDQPGGGDHCGIALLEEGKPGCQLVCGGICRLNLERLEANFLAVGLSFLDTECAYDAVDAYKALMLPLAHLASSVSQPHQASW